MAYGSRPRDAARSAPSRRPAADASSGVMRSQTDSRHSFRTRDSLASRYSTALPVLRPKRAFSRRSRRLTGRVVALREVHAQAAARHVEDELVVDADARVEADAALVVDHVEALVRAARRAARRAVPPRPRVTPA